MPLICADAHCAVISTGRVHSRAIHRSLQTWTRPSAAPGSNLGAQNTNGNPTGTLSCNESNVLPPRLMSNRFTAVGGHSESRIGMNAVMESSEFHLDSVHGPYERIDVPANLRNMATYDDDPEAQFDLGALLVREHFAQIDRHAAETQMQKDFLGSTTPLTSPRVDSAPLTARREIEDADKWSRSPALFEALKLFNSSSRRGHVQAQYTLGEVLWTAPVGKKTIYVSIECENRHISMLCVWRGGLVGSA
jgi:hypothetical protein